MINLPSNKSSQTINKHKKSLNQYQSNNQNMNLLAFIKIFHLKLLVIKIRINFSNIIKIYKNSNQII